VHAPSVPFSHYPFSASNRAPRYPSRLWPPGGNSYTNLIATIDPALANHDESLCTLQFANRCRNVTNQPRVNYMDTDMASQVLPPRNHPSRPTRPPAMLGTLCLSAAFLSLPLQQWVHRTQNSEVTVLQA